MLKAEYPCREILSSYISPNQTTITWTEAKQHLRDIRLRRQNQLTFNINECHRLHIINKGNFDRLLSSHSQENSSNVKIINESNNDYSFSRKKYVIPRIDYASIIYRSATPMFELEPSLELDNHSSVVQELAVHVAEDSNKLPNEPVENNRLDAAKILEQQRHLSVSPVSSVDKRTNKVYEKWPDYNQISEIIGYRIDHLPSKSAKENFTLFSHGPIDNQRKRTTSTGFAGTSKQIKAMISINPSSTRRKLAKTKLSIKNDTLRTVHDELPSFLEHPSANTITKEVKPKLPNYCCPSSAVYSARVRTREWLRKNNFSAHAFRAVPLI